MSVRPQHTCEFFTIEHYSHTKEVVIVKNFQKVLINYYIYYFLSSWMKNTNWRFSDYFSLTILLTSNSSAKRAVTISASSSQIFARNAQPDYQDNGIVKRLSKITPLRLALQERLIYLQWPYNVVLNSRERERERYWCMCVRLGVVAPSVVAFCASIKLCGRFISRSCLKHPPKRSSILALWAVDTGGWKCLNAVTIHDLERNILSCLSV